MSSGDAGECAPRRTCGEMERSGADGDGSVGESGVRASGGEKNAAGARILGCW